MQEMELYVHIPFCMKKCAYCDFLSAPATKETIQQYVQTLLCEIKQVGAQYRDTHSVTTIFVGGGTPSILTGEQMEMLFQALFASFHIEEGAEITVEVNPGTVTNEKLSKWKQSGINRLSIGLQSAKDEELALLGRIHTFADFLSTFKAVREAGFRNVNVDLISAIPGQNAESWKQTLEKVLELQPEHISAYSLIVEEGTPFYTLYGEAEADLSLPQLPDEETERQMYEMTSQMLARFGYGRYEISNYAREGFECRHNKGYWERVPYLGLGLGASSLMNNTRWRNTSDFQKYASGVRTKANIQQDVESLSVEEQMEEFMFLGLREMKGLSTEKFKEEFGQDVFQVYGSALERLSQQKLIHIQNNQIVLTKRGVDVSNAVFVEFLISK